MCFQGSGNEWEKCVSKERQGIALFLIVFLLHVSLTGSFLCSSEQTAWNRSENLRSYFHLVGSKYKLFFFQVSVMLCDRKLRRAHFLTCLDKEHGEVDTWGYQLAMLGWARPSWGLWEQRSESSQPTSTSSLNLGG